MSSLEKLGQRPMKWVDPCPGKVTGDVASSSSSFNKTELDNIITEASSMLNTVPGLLSDYASEAFQKPEESVREDLKNQKLEWLTNFYEVLEGDYKDAKVEDIFRNAYNMLQKMAVGLEQITFEQPDNSKFKEQFETLEFQVRRLLCELKDVMEFHGQSTPEDVPREIMQDKDRDNKTDTGFMKNRNYMIVRDFVKTLEYVKEAFGHFKELTTS